MPMSSWEPGEVILDSVSLDISGSVAPGTSSLVVVVYDHQSLGRLSARGPNSQGDHAVIASVMINS
jgi:hypothetical protein